MRLFLFVLLCLLAFNACHFTTNNTAPISFTSHADTGKAVLIQNSLPKGGLSYTHSDGSHFVYAIFWTSVLNQSTSPIELHINFPADSVPSPNSYIKLFLPPDTMSHNAVGLYDYGVTDLFAFLDSSLYTSTQLQRTIGPNESCLFNVAVLSSQPGATVRAGLELKDQDLFYRVTGITPELDSTFIRCGNISFKK